MPLIPEKTNSPATFVAVLITVPPVVVRIAVFIIDNLLAAAKSVTESRRSVKIVGKASVSGPSIILNFIGINFPAVVEDASIKLIYSGLLLNSGVKAV